MLQEQEHTAHSRRASVALTGGGACLLHSMQEPAPARTRGVDSMEHGPAEQTSLTSEAPQA